MEIFNFGEIVSKFGTKTAVVSANQNYSYNDLSKYAQELVKQYSLKKKYIVLVGNSSVLFICQFLAVHYAKRIPIVISQHDTDKLDKILINVANQWQFITDVVPTDDSLEHFEEGLLFCGATSGTTGLPKMYQRNWQSWRIGFEICNKIYELEEYQGITTTSPLTTSLGMHTLLLSLYFGKTFYTFDKADIIKNKMKTMLFTVPTYLSHVPQFKHTFQNINGIVSCGGELTNQIILKWKENHAEVKLYELYGSSETSLVAWQRVDGGKKDSCVGQLFPNVSVNFTKEKALMVKSPYLFSGYIGDAFQEPVLMDDVGTIKNNQLFIYARESDVINHGGNKVYPSEIEVILRKYLSDVVVFGVPNPSYGENIIVMTTTNLINIEKLNKNLANFLPKYKIPSEYISVEQIPETANHKISRKELVSLYEKGTYQ